MAFALRPGVRRDDLVLDRETHFAHHEIDETLQLLGRALAVQV